MSRRAQAHVRCTRCKMHRSLCICAVMPRLQTRTRLILLIHRIEARKPTNTGQLAALCLPNSDVVERGHQGTITHDGELRWPADSQPLMIFPHDDAVPIANFVGCDKPISLIVPDGTWRQAFKMKKRMPELAHVPCVSLPDGDETQYRLRIERRPGGLATIEAIARAFGILEGAEVERELTRIFHIMVERSLWARGSIATEDVTGGIPDGAQRHQPLR